MDQVQNSTPLPDFKGQSVQKSPVNKVLGVLLGLLVVGVIVIAAVWVSGWMSIKQRESEVRPTPPAQLLTPSVSPTPKDELEEATSVDVGDVEKDLQDVQKDASAL